MESRARASRFGNRFDALRAWPMPALSGMPLPERRNIACHTRYTVEFVRHPFEMAMRRFLNRKIGSLLGLFAILMATLAPPISHSLSNRLDPDELHGAFCSTRDGSDTTPPDTSPSPGHALHGQACAYCGLLAHMPVAPSPAAEFTPTTRTGRTAPARPVRPIHRPLPFTTAQPRAPPASS
ncbi:MULTISPECIES: DUF2946 domain-containing protein [Burkholderia]|jgi:hypothetical protein|uniref:DUF2946 domain-containing protein n=1 Tax=Burkholderia TaxID=32008 RepID=UPI0021CC9CD3|nr:MULTISPECIES: DUF2946 domain-containing protein [Burkholderia]